MIAAISVVGELMYHEIHTQSVTPRSFYFAHFLTALEVDAVIIMDDAAQVMHDRKVRYCTFHHIHRF